MPELEQGWKRVLVDYVNAINQAGVLGDAEAYRRIPVAEHRNRLVRRAMALSARRMPIPVKPIRGETRARILRETPERKGAVVEVQLHLLRSYEQNGHPWLEERLDRERIRIVELGSRWRIDSIEPLAGEIQAASFYNVTDTGLYEMNAGFSVQHSVPYIPRRVQYAPGARVYAGWEPGYPAWGGRAGRGTVYRREAAVEYAEQWWNKPNPSYDEFEVNCTNYVSQCLFAGGAPIHYTGQRESGWWYKGRVNGQEQWSFSWAVANSLQHYLSQPHTFALRARAVDSPTKLQLGDVICYDWDGDGQFRHNTFVTAFTPEGMPLVNANTVPSRHRYWDYRDSYAWTERTRYRFFHIDDDL